MKKVLIVGSGPTGLISAAVLKRHGVDVMLVERYPGVLKATKAAALQPRTLEVLDDLGLADRIVDEGQLVEYMNLRTAYTDKLTISFRDLNHTKFPFMIFLSQYRVEEMLHDLLAELGIETRRKIKLTDLKQEERRVRVKLQPVEDDGGTPAGESEDHFFDYVIGCDGVHSTVRTLIGRDFHGESYAEPWALTDIKAEWPLPRNEFTFSSDRTGICGVFPLQGEKEYRVAYTQMLDKSGKPIPPNEENLKAALLRQGHEFELLEIGKFWTFNLAHRQTEHYRAGNVFLAGDAGHVHTPFGGQGLNLSVTDAYNLCWKLAAVIDGVAGDKLLDTYNDERHPVAARVVRMTHIGASAMLQRKLPMTPVRDAAFMIINRREQLKRRMASELAQLTHTYRSGSRFANGLHEGDRLPNIRYRDGYSDTNMRLHDAVQPGVLNVICTVEGLEPSPVEGFVKALGAVKRRAAMPVRTILATRFHLPEREACDGVDEIIYDRRLELGDAFDYDSQCFIVRPDSHVGSRGIAADENSILNAIGKLYDAPTETRIRRAAA